MSEGFGASIPKSKALFERARQVIPGGIYGHVQPSATIPGVFPYFAERGEGGYYWDVDGRKILDLMCGYGPLILGYHHQEIEEAAAIQRAKGLVFNHPASLSVELAEKLVDRVGFADWTVFGKNGSDMTTWAIQVAREHTKRSKIAVVSGAYHGVDAWCTPGKGGLILEDRVHIHTFEWNNLDSLQSLFSDYAKQFAAVVVTPFHHPAFGESELPHEGFLDDLEQLCHREGVLLVLDDIRAGFRLHAGGSHRPYGFEPDLSCYCKALANGYSISATAGKEEFRKAATRVFLTGSYWNNPVPMAASLACLEIIARESVPEHLEQMGLRLQSGISAVAKAAGVDVRWSGPPSMPYLSIRDDPNLYLIQEFAAKSLDRGVFFHPHHNWFLSQAHKEKEIDLAIEVAGDVFRSLQNG